MGLTINKPDLRNEGAFMNARLLHKGVTAQQSLGDTNIFLISY